MTGQAIESLEELLRALGKQRSLRGRLRVLGRSWQLLRSLSPGDREKVALRVGSSWAWKRLEKSFLADGELSETERTVGRIFEKMGDADPGELRSLASSIRRGDRQAGKDLLLMTLTEALEEEAEDEAAHDAATIEPEPLAAEPPADTPVSIEAVEPVVRQPATGHTTPAGDREVPEAPAPPAESSAVPLPSPPQQVAPPPITKPPAALPPAEAEASETLPEFGERPATTGAERLRVLRALQQTARPGANLGRAGRARLLESLGGGWASRRALSRMIAQHSLDGVDEALALIALLGGAGQRTWCLSDLIEHWPLDEAAEQRVLAAVPTDAARRRLVHRLS